MSGAATLDGEFEVVEAGFKMFCKEQQNVKKTFTKVIRSYYCQKFKGSIYLWTLRGEVTSYTFQRWVGGRRWIFGFG